MLQWGPHKKLRAWAWQMKDVLDAHQIGGSSDGSIVFNELAQGIDMCVAPWVLNGLGGSLPGGFKVEKSVANMRVRYGVVNSITPSGMTEGDAPPFIIAPSGLTGSLYIAVTTGDTGGGVIGAISADIVSPVGDPLDDNPAGVYYQPIGSYTHVDGFLVCTPGGQGNGIGDQRFELCGGAGGSPQWGPA